MLSSEGHPKPSPPLPSPEGNPRRFYGRPFVGNTHLSAKAACST